MVIDKDNNGFEMDITKYRGIIGSLLYLTESMLYTMFNVCMCARYQVSHRESHFKIIKRI